MGVFTCVISTPERKVLRHNEPNDYTIAAGADAEGQFAHPFGDVQEGKQYTVSVSLTEFMPAPAPDPDPAPQPGPDPEPAGEPSAVAPDEPEE